MGVGRRSRTSASAASPTTLLTYARAANDPAITVEFKQHVAITDALRAGRYSKTLTFTLSTTASLMSFTYKFLLALVVALAVPASAAAAPGSIRTLRARGVRPRCSWMPRQTNPRDNSVSILPGETVTFSYAVGDGTNAHNVGFYTFSPQPNSCMQTQGTVIPGFPVPPLPAFTFLAPWAGFCTFNNPGTYSFYCTVHGEMTGIVIVAAAQNQPPTVTASRTPTGDVTTGTSIAFSATGTDTDGDTLTYAWDFGDGQTSTRAEPVAQLQHGGHQDRQGHGLRRQGRDG